MGAPKYTMTNDSVMVLLGGESYTVKRGAPNFEPLRQAVLAGAWDKVPEFLSVSSAIEKWADGEFALQDDRIVCKGEPLPEPLSKRVLEMITTGKPYRPMLRFWERLRRNPSKWSVDQLWSFLAHRGMPLTADGCFLGYKGVGEDFKDCHSRRFENRPGARFEMPRSEVDDNPKSACSRGFHVGSESYARGFGSKVVIIKVDPEFVVSVPSDCNCEKMRVCRYEVVGIYGMKLDDLLEEKLPEVAKTEVVVDALPPKVDKMAALLALPLEEAEDFRSLVTDSCGFCDQAIRKGHTAFLVRDMAFHRDCLNQLREKKGLKPLATPAKSEKPAPVKKPARPVKRAKPGTAKLVVKITVPKPASTWAESQPSFDESTWAKFDQMDSAALMEQGIEVLRRYASMHLKIVGAYKMTGGKTALLVAIQNAR